MFKCLVRLIFLTILQCSTEILSATVLDYFSLSSTITNLTYGSKPLPLLYKISEAPHSVDSMQISIKHPRQQLCKLHNYLWKCCVTLWAALSTPNRPVHGFILSSFILKALGRHQKPDQALQRQRLPSGGQKLVARSTHSHRTCSTSDLLLLIFIIWITFF